MNPYFHTGPMASTYTDAAIKAYGEKLHAKGKEENAARLGETERRLKAALQRADRLEESRWSPENKQKQLLLLLGERWVKSIVDHDVFDLPAHTFGRYGGQHGRWTEKVQRVKVIERRHFEEGVIVVRQDRKKTGWLKTPYTLPYHAFMRGSRVLPA